MKKRSSVLVLIVASAVDSVEIESASGMRRFGQLWRESASLILVARGASRGESYKTLLLRRSAQSTFHQYNVSFPGGVLDSQDEDARAWLAFFKENQLLDRLRDLRVRGQRPFIFERDPDDTANAFLEREISLRLSAIRELFEEVGVLLCSPKERIEEDGRRTAGFVADFDPAEWQRKIHHREATLLQLCERFEVVPDLWSLFEWSAWLSPTVLDKKRFETAFFLAGVDQQPPVHPEKAEVAEIMWEEPEKLLKLNQKEALTFAPPQIYELSRLKSERSFDKLMEFAKNRNSKGLTLNFPVHYKLKDGAIFALPGDDLYPQTVAYTEPPEVMKRQLDQTIKEAAKSAKKLHRMAINADSKEAKILFNATPSDEHLSPVQS